MKTNAAIINLHTGQAITPEEHAAARAWAPRREEEPEPCTLGLATLAARLEYQEHKRQPSQNIHGVHVGDLFYTSWGYEQTNVTFWQVVQLKGKATAVVREIKAEITRSTGWEQGYKRPCRDHWASKELHTVRIQPDRYRQDNGASMRAPGLHGHTAHLTTDASEHSYTSYY